MLNHSLLLEMKFMGVKPKNILIVGIDVANLALSTNRAGYNVFSVDFFGDLDLRKACFESLSIAEQVQGKVFPRFDDNYDPMALVSLAEELTSREKIDGILLSSGLEDFPDLLTELAEQAPIIGNSPETINGVRDRSLFFRELKRLGVHFPITEFASDLIEAKNKARDIGYPVVLKPSVGFGGVGIRVVRSKNRVEDAFKQVSRHSEKILIQELIIGEHASSSVIATKHEARALTVNEQVLGSTELGQVEPFGYCGNIVPISTLDSIEYYRSVAEKVVSHFGLVGSNGVDFVISEDTPFVIEVNPRFQGTLECIERVVDINLVETHINACVEDLIPQTFEASCFCTRLILFAPFRCIIPDLTSLEYVRDIPLPNIIIQKGEPVCSVISDDKSGKTSLSKAFSMAGEVQRKLIQA